MEPGPIFPDVSNMTLAKMNKFRDCVQESEGTAQRDFCINGAILNATQVNKLTPNVLKMEHGSHIQFVMVT